MRHLQIFISLLVIILCSFSMHAQQVFESPLQPRPREEYTNVVIPGWERTVPPYDVQSSDAARNRTPAHYDWPVAADHRFVAILTDQYGELPRALYVLDDASSSPRAKLIATLPKGRFRGLGVNDGIIWMATDSIYSFNARTGHRLAAMALPTVDGTLRATAAHLLWIQHDAVLRYEYDALRWQTLLHWQLGADDKEAYILDALDRRDGLFVLVHHESNDDGRERNRLWNFVDGRCLESSLVVHSMASTHCFTHKWRIEDVSSGIAHTQNREIVSVGNYDLSSRIELGPYRGGKLYQGRLWGLDNFSTIVSYGSDGRVDHSFPIPLLPTNRKYNDMFCLDNRCYINTDAGVFSAPYQKGAVDLERRSSMNGLREVPNSRLLIPFAGELSYMDLQGRVVLNSSVETGEYEIPTIASGVYCATLAGPNGSVQRLTIVR